MTSTRILKKDGLVKVARAQNQSMLRRAPGFDVPDFLAAGARDVLVRASAERVAREVLPQGEAETPVGASVAAPPGRLLAGVLIAVSLVAIIVWLGALGA